jgi:hypothetical protein
MVHTQEQDILRWQLTQSGQCSTKEHRELPILITKKMKKRTLPTHRAADVSPHNFFISSTLWKHKTIAPRIKAFS